MIISISIMIINVFVVAIIIIISIIIHMIVVVPVVFRDILLARIGGPPYTSNSTEKQHCNRR